MTSLRLHICALLCLGAAILPSLPPSLQSETGETSRARMWDQLLADSAKLHLPIRFLQRMPADFVHFAFEDLHTYAAEYHPGEHRLVLNRTLSFNAAGGSLKPLAKMTHKELEVLYHELFHAYMDFLASRGEQGDPAAVSSDSLLSFARTQQGCRYGEVAITPVVQRRNEAESRYLTEAESWEALNETWAVFIGWAVWNQLEVQQKSGESMFQKGRGVDQWLVRFEQAVRNGDLRGYYVPEDPDERRVTQKRFLAKQSQLTGLEALVLMKQVLGFPEKITDKLKSRPGLSSFFRQGSVCRSSVR